MSALGGFRTLRLLLFYLRVRIGRKRAIPGPGAKDRARIDRFLTEILRRSPFYRALGETSFERLPVIDRSVYAARFDELNTLGLRNEEILAACREAEKSGARAPDFADCTVGLSSGTSESRGLFVVTREERTLHAAHFLAKILRRPLLGPSHRIAYFLRADAALYDTARSRRVRFRHFDLAAPIESRLEDLEAFDPTFLFAPASVLRRIADARREGSIRLAALAQVLTGAEALDPLDRFHLERDFGLPIDQVYQCTEGFLAYTCDRGSWHLNEDLLIVEKDWLDPERRRFAPIVTDLHRLAQPYVRYRVSDVLLELTPEEAARPCACGSPLARFASVTGRESDLLRLGSGPGPAVVFHDQVQSLFFGFREALRGYRVLQRGETLEVELLPLGEGPAAAGPELENGVRAALIAFFSEKKLKLPEIAFAPYREPAAPAKLRRIVRES